MGEEKTCKNIVIEEYKDSVDLYLRNGCTEFHRGLTVGVERILKRLGATPFEIVRLYNKIWQPWHDEIKTNNHSRLEIIPTSDISKPIFEGCTCDECEARRNEIRRRIKNND